MSQDPLSGHPDVTDPDWLAKANRDAKKDIRRMRRAARWRRWRGRLVSVVLLAAIVVVAQVMYTRGLFGGGDSTGTGSTPTSGAPATTVTTMIPDVVVDLNQPFVGTPAAGWADGEAGIVPPVAEAVGDYRAEQVTAAYEKVRQVVSAARLDRAVIEGRDVERFLALLAPEAQANIRPDFANLAESDAWATRIADGFRLLPVPPKVNGRMWATVDADGALIVHTDYIVAYAFHTDRPDRLHDVMDIVVVSRSQADYAVLGDRWPPSSRGVWVGDYQGYTYSMACAAAVKGLLAPAYSERTEADAQATRDRDDFFDPTKPLPTEDTCPE